MIDYTMEDLKELLRHNPHFLVSSKVEKCLKGKTPLSDFEESVRDNVRKYVKMADRAYGDLAYVSRQYRLPSAKLSWLDFETIFNIMFLVRFEYLPCYMDSADAEPYVQWRLALGK